MGCTWVAAAALATAALLRGAEQPPNAIVVGVGLAGAIAWAFALPRAGCLATVAAWAACIAQSSWRRPAASVVGLALAPVLLVLAFVRPLLLREELQLYLHDTYFAVGQWHLWAAAIAFAALAALLAWAPVLLGREPHAGLVRLGAACCGAGTLTHAVAELVLGARGMPRRYLSYIPDYLTGHRAAMLGALLATAGLAIIVLACLRGQRANTAYSGS
jgi:heme/copper-type cytochrome/quinol oxidase subunit 1